MPNLPLDHEHFDNLQPQSANNENSGLAGSLLMTHDATSIEDNSIHIHS